MDPKQRFKLDRPCPVCGGHSGMPQGEGRRCYGFLSEDGLFAHCTREEYAGHLDRNGDSNTYAHYLKGDCRRWTRRGSTPSRRQSRRSKRALYKHPKLGRPDQLWPYRYADGTLAGYAARWDKPDGDKEIRPLVFEDGRWRPKGIDRPRPLYNLPELLNRDFPYWESSGSRGSPNEIVAA